MREEDPAYQDKWVNIVLINTKQETRVTITDQGEGFNWGSYMDIDPVRALDSHGRGIAQANKISFDELIYNKQGNQVTAITHNGSGIQW